MPAMIPVRRLLAVANPVSTPPWDCNDLLQPQMVHAALQTRDFRQNPVPDELYHLPQPHAQRIAWLMHEGWDDPIEVDVGIPSLGYYPEWIVYDGNHRLYAAVLLKQRSILTEVSGSLNHAKKLFKMPVKARGEGPAGNPIRLLC